MSKKKQRQRRKAPVVARVNGATTSSGTTKAPVVERGFNPDYTNVIKDLKRIGILASSFILILVVLSFFLR
jgi:hypothetical protein